MKIETGSDAGTRTVSLTGMLDSHTSSEMLEISLKELDLVTGDGQLLFDMSQLEYTASAGIRAFLTILKTAMTKRKKVVFKGMRPAVREVFELSGLTDIMVFAD